MAVRLLHGKPSYAAGHVYSMFNGLHDYNASCHLGGLRLRQPHIFGLLTLQFADFKTDQALQLLLELANNLVSQRRSVQ